MAKIDGTTNAPKSNQIPEGTPLERLKHILKNGRLDMKPLIPKAIAMQGAKPELPKAERGSRWEGNKFIIGGGGPITKADTWASFVSKRFPKTHSNPEAEAKTKNPKKGWFF